MRKTILIFLILFPFILLGQTYQDKSMYKGDYTILQFNHSRNIIADSIFFAVKPDREDSSGRLIQKWNDVGGGADTDIEVIGKVILVKLLVDDTEGLTAATYVYDLTADSTTIFTGYLKIVDEVTGSADGVPTRTPYYIVALDTPNVANTFIVGQDSDNVWYRRTVDQVREILNLDTNDVNANFDSLYTYWMNKHEAQTITGQKNFSGGIKVRSDSTITLGTDSVGLAITRGTAYRFLLLKRSDQPASPEVQIDVDNGGLVLSPPIAQNGLGTPNQRISLEGARTDETGDQVYDWALGYDRFSTTSPVLRIMNDTQADYITLIAQQVQFTGTGGETRITSNQKAVIFRDESGDADSINLTFGNLASLGLSANYMLGNLYIGENQGGNSNAKLQVDGSIGFDSSGIITNINGITRFLNYNGTHPVDIVAQNLFLNGDTTTSLADIYVDSTLRIMSQGSEFRRRLETGEIGIHEYSVPDTIVGQVSLYNEGDELKVRNGAGRITTLSGYELHESSINLLNPTVDDTVFIGRMEIGAVFDSIRVFDVLDSIAIQLFYRDPTDNNLITTVDTLTTDTTIAFDTTTIPANAKVYMYCVYVGDSEAYIRSELYWRE